MDMKLKQLPRLSLGPWSSVDKCTIFGDPNLTTDVKNTACAGDDPRSGISPIRAPLAASSPRLDRSHAA